MTALIALTADGERMARRIQAEMPRSEVHGLDQRTSAPDVPFEDTVTHLQGLFREGAPIVGFCAVGILVRALAPLITDKMCEPPVVAVAQDGSTVVPVIGGHSGGNRLARDIGAALDVDAAVTTAGDIDLGFALDDPPAGWSVGNRSAAKAVAAAMIAGAPVGLIREPYLPMPVELSYRFSDENTRPAVRITDREVDVAEDVLDLHPHVLAVGVGCERNASVEELQELAESALRSLGLCTDAVACIGSIDLKSDETAVNALGAAWGRPNRFFDAATLEAETPRLQNPSDVVFAEVGCHGVAEGAALAAVGRVGDLIIEKHKSKRATCAVARAPQPVQPGDVGTARGRLSIVGIGPGQAAWRTPEVTSWLSQATDVVGYGLYLDLLGDLIVDKQRHMSELSDEEARVRRSIELAAEGREVALVSSGDAGIYAMASLAFEVLDRDNNPTFNRIDIRVSPGISAVQAAAARIGAPLGHDFALISLSDLLTPWEVIENRIEAVAHGDFTVAFYNPVSKRRRTQLARAKEILLTKRSPDVPVVLGRNLGRDTEQVTVLPLGDLEVDDVDMLTLVLVGSSTSKAFKTGDREWVYTPRGYAKKMEAST